MTQSILWKKASVKLSDLIFAIRSIAPIARERHSDRQCQSLRQTNYRFRPRCCALPRAVRIATTNGPATWKLATRDICLAWLPLSSSIRDIPFPPPDSHSLHATYRRKGDDKRHRLTRSRFFHG